MSRATNQQIAQGFAQGLQNFTQGYVKRKDREHAQEILDNPDSTPVQKALAWESIAEGQGVKAYDSILKEQALKKEEANTTNIRNEINGVQTDVGERAQVGKVESFNSPVDYANQMVANDQMGPEEQPYGQQLPNEPITPAMQAMAQTQQNAQEQPPALEQGGQQPKKPGIQDVPTERLQEFLGQTKDAPTIRQIQSELKRRSDVAHDRAKVDAQRVKDDVNIAEENRKEIRDYSEPYQDIAGMEKSLHKLDQAEDLIMNSEDFSLDETFIPTVLQAYAQGKGKEEIAELLKTPAQQKMFYLMYDFIKPKELGGSNPSTKEVLLSMSKLVNPYKGKAANMFIIQNMKDEARIQLEKGKAIREARGAGISNFSDFQNTVDSIVGEKAAQIRQESENKFTVVEASEYAKKNPPKSGYMWMLGKDKKAKQIPVNRVRELQADGAVLLNG